MRSLLRRGIAWAVAGVYRAYYATLRLHAVMPDGTVVTTPSAYPYGPEVFALCERDALAFGGVLSGRRFAVLVAPGRDGDRATALLEAMSCRVIRGASRRGGAEALRAVVQLLREAPEPLGLVVDGPLGPAGIAKRGAVVCALETGRPLRALGAAARHGFVFPGTWSGIYLPLPFTRLVIIIDDVPLAGTASGADIPALTEDLTLRLARARARAVSGLSGSEW
jgi:lysophospholipid acyltransferase (LPLAT)-like uncharacterized protein